MEELDISTITKRSIHGVFALVSRTFFIQVISVLVNFLLTVFLSPSVFGVFFIVSAFIAFLSYFSDIGLAAALIQKKESITDDDLKTTFTIQQILVIALMIIALLASNAIGQFYKLDESGVRLFQALVLAFFLSSLKTIPSIILERNLNFQKLVIPQVVETLFFNLTALFFAVKGFGITSFTYAVLARGVSGVLVIYLIAPWHIRLGLSKNAAKKLLSFGVPFQLNSLLALVKDDLLTVYLGSVLPLSQVGYIGFAQKWAFTPLRVIMDNVIRVTFPSFSRLAHDKNNLARAIEKSLFASSLFIFPSIIGLVALSPYFIHFVPKYQKWEPALLSLGFFSLNAALSSVSTPLTNAINAIGKIKITLYLMIFWTIATWILTPLAISFWGFNGVAITSAIIAFSVVGVVWIIKRHIELNVFKAISYPLFAALIMGITLYVVGKLIVTSVFLLALAIFVSAMIYFVMIYILARQQIMSDVKLILNNLRK